MSHPALLNNEDRSFLLSLFSARLGNGSSLDSKRDIDAECGYPAALTASHMKQFFRREGIAARVISVFPEESWASIPSVFETEDKEKTPFEKDWARVCKKNNILGVLQRADILSGIGRFGVVLLGFDDGKQLHEPLAGVTGSGEFTGQRKHSLLYTRTLDETLVDVSEYETDTANPRFGMPKVYGVKFATAGSSASGTSTPESNLTKVHWTRMIHLADNRMESEVFGTPRLELVYNRIYDLRKILSSSGEMFWKGGFPGYTFETDPAMQDAQLDTESLRAEFAKYSNGLQRFLAVTGVKAKALELQVADPNPHVRVQLLAIALSLGCPLRIFLGSEEAKLASSQDAITWNKRLAKRCNNYITPYVLRPLIDRLIEAGTVAAPTSEEGYHVEWSDLNTPTEDDKASLAQKRSQALAMYTSSGADTLMPPRQFFIFVLGMDDKEADSILDAAQEYTGDGFEKDGIAEEDEVESAPAKGVQTGKTPLVGNPGGSGNES